MTTVKPGVLTHGTLEIKDVQKSMPFYRDFLNMEVIQHIPFGCRITLGGEWYIICLETKERHEMPLFNHFGIDVESREEVDRWYERAIAEKDIYGLKKISKPKAQHGSYQFYLNDCDDNWWEIQHYEGDDSKEAHLNWGANQSEKYNAMSDEKAKMKAK